ncbi:MAG TPA: hypothetical protein VFG98_09620 [Intrasporangium sp.]|nr:hypothetical protein [Intrasporangium sp.]
MPPLLADPLIRVLGVVEDGSRVEDLRDHGLHVVPTAPPLPLGASHDPGRMPLSSLPDERAVPYLPHAQARETVAERFVAADACLPHGVRLVVVEGLRRTCPRRRRRHAGGPGAAPPRPLTSLNRVNKIWVRTLSQP